MVRPELNDYLDWPYVAQVFRLERAVWHERQHNWTRQVVYGMTSLTPQKASPIKLLALTRQYGGIESGLRYRRDVTLHEDEPRLTIVVSGHNMAILNNLIIGLCIQCGCNNIAKARRQFCAHPQHALNMVTSKKILSCESSNTGHKLIGPIEYLC